MRPSPSAGAIVHLPSSLRDRVGKRASVRADGETVRAIIHDLDRQYPGMRAALCEETGNIRPFVNIFLGNDHIRDLQGLETPVPRDAAIHVLLSVAGGDEIQGG
jgi:molybdopterin synthase sulfur carrier subunit